MTNKISSFPAHNDPGPLHRHAGRVTSTTELAITAVGDDYAVVGSGTIRALPALPVGCTVVLNILNSPTFVHSMKLILPEAANYDASPGDYVIARSDGDGIWRLFVLPATPSAVAPPQGRLTLTSGVAVMQTSVANATTVYYTPYGGNRCPVSDGQGYVARIFAELAQATTDGTKSPEAAAASSNYDMFVWNDAGTIRCTRGPAWANASTRSLVLTLIYGLLVNSADVTNGPAAYMGTYVGTIRTNASAGVDYIFGTAAVGGGAAVLNVWNAFNRVTVAANVTDTASGGYAYTSATIRQAKASAGNQISFVLGLQEDSVSCSYASKSVLVGAVGAAVSVGFGFDTNAAFTGQYYYSYNQTTTVAAAPAGLAAQWPMPGIGAHVISANEQGDGLNANTFNQVGLATLGASLRM